MKVLKNTLSEDFKEKVLGRVEILDKIEFQVERFPHLDYITSSTSRHEKMIHLLNNRRTLAKENANNLSEYEQNELEILLLDTDEKLAKYHKQLVEKKKYVQEFTEILLKQIDDCNNNLIEKVDKAVNFYANNYTSKKNDKVAQLGAIFMDLKDKDLEGNWEERLAFFIALKRIMKLEK